MVNLDFQLDWIERLGNGTLGGSARPFLRVLACGKATEGGKTCTECRKGHPIGWGPKWHKCEKEESIQHI
jgi:hypothetical protein